MGEAGFDVVSMETELSGRESIPNLIAEGHEPLSLWHGAEYVMIIIRKLRSSNMPCAQEKEAPL